MHHKNSIISTFLMGGFLALSLAACESPKPPYPDNGEPTTTTGTTGTTSTTGTTVAGYDGYDDDDRVNDHDDRAVVRYPSGDLWIIYIQSEQLRDQAVRYGNLGAPGWADSPHGNERYRPRGTSRGAIRQVGELTQPHA